MQMQCIGQRCMFDIRDRCNYVVVYTQKPDRSLMYMACTLDSYTNKLYC